MSKLSTKNLILGTAQLGAPYGLGQWRDDTMPEQVALGILDLAAKYGIGAFDTSPDYGSAEQRLHSFISESRSDSFTIFTKIKLVPDVEDKNSWESVKSRLLTLKNNKACDNLYLLLHDERDLSRQYVVRALRALVSDGFMDGWGVSVYSQEAARKAVEVQGCKIVQLPISLFNQSFIRSGVVEMLSNARVEIIARSVFVQGVLLSRRQPTRSLDRSQIVLLEEIEEFAEYNRMSVAQVMVCTVLGMSGVGKVVFGVDNNAQLAQICDRFDAPNITPLPQDLIDRLAQQDCNFFRPETWKT